MCSQSVPSLESRRSAYPTLSAVDLAHLIKGAAIQSKPSDAQTFSLRMNSQTKGYRSLASGGSRASGSGIHLFWAPCCNGTSGGGWLRPKGTAMSRAEAPEFPVPRASTLYATTYSSRKGLHSSVDGSPDTLLSSRCPFRAATHVSLFPGIQLKETNPNPKP